MSQMTILPLSNTATSFLLSYGLNSPELNFTDYKIYRVIVQVNKTEDIKQY